LILSVLLVILVVFVFLRNGRATLIPAVAVPVSLVGTFAVMYLLGFSLDNLSLMAMTIATGFVVDDAIVVMENISRHREEGMSPFQAALLGSKEIGFTVFTISMSLIAVFIPILLMAALWKLFREFAITLSTAILVSMVISLTTTPMMCAYLLKDESKIKHGRMFNLSEKGSKGWSRLHQFSYLGTRPSSSDAYRSSADDRAQFLFDRDYPEGILPAARYGRHCGRGARPAGCILRGDGQFRAATGGCDQGRPCVANVNAYTGSSNGGSSISR